MCRQMYNSQNDPTLHRSDQYQQHAATECQPLLHTLFWREYVKALLCFSCIIPVCVVLPKFKILRAV